MMVIVMSNLPALNLFLMLITVMMLSAAVLTLILKNHIAATASASVVSLGLAVIFVLLKAPDVAMTEAAVGAGLSSLILALGLRRLGLLKLDTSDSPPDSINVKDNDGRHD